MSFEDLSSTSARPERAFAGVARDERGAVMVLGIFMCATLVSALWYIAGIGDAIVYRERLQEAADAGAFSDAVLHARGMNLIVLLNLIMACVLAIRVALKVIQLALIFAGVVFFGLSLIPFNPLAGFLAELANLCRSSAQTVQNVIKQTRDPINNTLKGLHEAEVAIARVVPGASLAGSKQVIDKYQPFITSGFSSPLPEKLAKGLPVVDGTTDRLCGKAGEAMASLVDSLLPFDLGSFKGTFEGIMAKIVEGGSSYFCELGGSGSPPNLDSLTNDTAKDRCDNELKQKQQDLADRSKDWHAECDADMVTCVDEVPNDPLDPGAGTHSDMQGLDALQKSTKPADQQALVRLNTAKQKRDAADDAVKAFDEPKCIENAKNDINNQIAQLPPSTQSNSQGMEPMKVDPNWFNGTQDAQVLSYVRGDDKVLKRSPQLVKIGGWKDRRASGTIDTPTGADFGYAQAEFFYDCVGDWKSTECNSGKSPYNDDEEAMWHIRWRARLRRYNKPFDAVDVVLDAFVIARALEMQASSIKNATLDFGNGKQRGKLMSSLSLDSFKVH